MYHRTCRYTSKVYTKNVVTIQRWEMIYVSSAYYMLPSSK